MTIDDIKNLDLSKCEKFSSFAKDKLPMPGQKKYLDQILNKEIFIIDFRIMDSKHRENSKCLQVQFIMDGEIYIFFTGSLVLLNQISSYRDKLPFSTIISKVDKYYSLS